MSSRRPGDSKAFPIIVDELEEEYYTTTQEIIPDCPDSPSVYENEEVFIEPNHHYVHMYTPEYRERMALWMSEGHRRTERTLREARRIMRERQRGLIKID